MPYCPVRPQQFGYYGTRWRRWPGQEIMQVSDERAAAPAQPPRSEVPGANEESMTPRTIEPPADAGGAELPATVPEPEPAAARPEPELPPRAEPGPMPAAPPKSEPTPSAKGPAGEPEPPSRPRPDATPAPELERTPETKPEPAEENLFELLSGTGWKAKRRFPATPPGGQSPGGAVQPARHLMPADPRDVPRVGFDPAAETRRLRSAR